MNLSLFHLHLISSEMRNLKKKLPRFQTFRQNTNVKSLTLKLGLVFPTSSVFKDDVREYAIRARKDLHFKKNDNTRVRTECRDLNCSWTCFASMIRDSKQFIFKKFHNEHSCPRVNKNRFATSKWFAKTYMQ